MYRYIVRGDYDFMINGWKNKETYLLGCMIVDNEDVRKLFVERVGNVSSIMLERLVKKLYSKKKIKYDKVDWDDLIEHLKFLYLNSN
jgi:hypothetical protein